VRDWRGVRLLGIVALMSGFGLAGCSGGSNPPPSAAGSVARQIASSQGGARAKPVRRFAQPVEPGALAAGPHGLVYVADDRAQRIYAWHPSGRFTVVAGTGRRGFSGDGGPAKEAELSYPGGMVYDSARRTLYIADEGNNRVRAINRHGRIRTVVGDGEHRPRCSWVTSGTAARSACLFGPGAVSIAPNGQLLIAATGNNEILELRHGRLRELAGRRNKAGVVGLGGPATRASPDGPNGLALDGQGNLWITGSNTKTLLVITPSGLMRRPADSSHYPRGDGGVLPDPSGGVLLMDTSGSTATSAWAGRARSRTSPAAGPWTVCGQSCRPASPLPPPEESSSTPTATTAGRAPRPSSSSHLISTKRACCGEPVRPDDSRADLYG
jgi:DNA-binding beta-propeller fold protein YncE